MDKDTAIFVAVVLVLVLYFLTESTFLLAVIAALGVLYVLPSEQLPKLLGYIAITDIVFSVWLMHMAVGTFGGFQVAILTALVYAVLSRELRALWGTKVLSINGQVKLTGQLRELSAYGFAWLSSIGDSLAAGHIIAPPALDVTWVVGMEPGGWKATRTYKSIAALWAALTRRTVIA